MRDDKKRDRALQRHVRERQIKTGESYQAAWQQLNVSKVSKGHRRVPLPMSTNVAILPGQSALIIGRPQLASFWPDRLLINNAGHWDVESFIVGNCKEAEFSLVETGKHTATAYSPDVWQPLARREVFCGEEVILVVTYTGSDELGEPFFATLFGWEDELPPVRSTRQTDERRAERISERAISKSVSVRQPIKLPLPITSTALFVDHFTITDARDWIVNDIVVREKSIFVQPGDLPGEMFSGSEQVVLAPLVKDDLVEIVATYLGDQTSACLEVELSGAATSPTADRAISCFLPMSTPLEISIEPTQSAQITGRPRVRDFLPERLVIADADNWIVNDIRIGVRSQLAQSGDIPGQSFAGRTADGHVRLDPVHEKQDFIIVTTCIGMKAASFFCGVQGRLVEEAR
jgi:hypothetical protein